MKKKIKKLEKKSCEIEGIDLSFELKKRFYLNITVHLNIELLNSMVHMIQPNFTIDFQISICILF